MPKGKRVSQEALMKEARKRLGELAKAGVEDMDWEKVRLYEDENRNDYVQKRLLGISRDMLEKEHEINQMPFRLANAAEGPQKEAAAAVLETYQEYYERVTTLRFEQQVMNEASSLLEKGVYTLSKEEKEAFSDQNRAHAQEYYSWMERLGVCQSFAGSFFGAPAAPANRAVDPEAPEKPLEYFARLQTLQDIGAKLPQTPEYEVFRTSRHYETQEPLAMEPREAVMNMNPTVLTSITVNDFPASIRKENPAKEDLDWGVTTFDDMMERLYSKDQWNALKRDQKNLLNTVYLNGRPLYEAFPSKEGETRRNYERRVKSEVVAYALEGKGTIDVTPYRKENGSYTFGDPVPVRANVNLPEKVSGWKRFLSFFNVKFELKKEKAKRISCDDLSRDSYLDEIRERVQRMNERAEDSRLAREKKEEADAHLIQGDLDFFGYLVPRDENKELTGIDLARYQDQVSAKVHQLTLVEISKELQDELGVPEARLAMTLERMPTRTSLVRIFALSRGMSMEEVLSPDPALRERKSQIGREFMEAMTVQSPEDFYKEKGNDADYGSYFQEKRKKAYQTFRTLNQKIADLPYDCFHMDSVREQARDYEKLDMVLNACVDLGQACPGYVKEVGFNRLDAVEQKSLSTSLLVCARTYLDEYVATDAYVCADMLSSTDRSNVLKGVTHKMVGDMITERTQGMTKMGDLVSVIDGKWMKGNRDFEGKLNNKLMDMELCKDAADYLEGRGTPVCWFNEQRHVWEVDRAQVIAQRTQAQMQQADRQPVSGRQPVTLGTLAGTEGKSRGPLPDKEKQPLSREPLQKKGPVKKAPGKAGL